MYAAVAGLAVGLRAWRERLPETVALTALVGLALVSRHFVIAFAALAAPSLSEFLNSQHQKLAASRSPLLRPVGITIWVLMITAILVTPRLLEERERHPFGDAVQVLLVTPSGARRTATSA